MRNMNEASTGVIAAHRTVNILTGSEREVALQRFHLLRPAIENGVPLTRVARDENVSLRTAQRWMAAYGREGMAGLANAPAATGDNATNCPNNSKGSSRDSRSRSPGPL